MYIEVEDLLVSLVAYLITSPCDRYTTGGRSCDSHHGSSMFIRLDPCKDTYAYDTWN